MVFHWVRAQAFVHATESREKVETAMRFVCGAKAKLLSSNTRGFYGNPIEILEATLKGKKDIDELFRRLVAASRTRSDTSDEDFAVPGFLSDDDIEKRIDGECILYFRLDKQEAFMGRFVPVTHDDVIAVRAKVETYPASREKAVNAVRSYLTVL
jgi:hypothetical protein